MSSTHGAVDALKRAKQAVVRRLPVGARRALRDGFHRTRLRFGRDPLARPGEHQRFLEEHAPKLWDGRSRPLTYVEFGVYQGASLAAAVKAFDALGITAGSRFVGLDSFEGLPPGSEDEGWGTGWFTSSRATAEWNLRRHGVLRRVELVEGWFDVTCTPALAHRIGRVDVAMFDCDIYSATDTALRFVEPIMADRCLMIFDDWLAFNVEESPEIGQVKAFRELRERRPGLAVERLGRVGHHGIGFLVTSVEIPASPEQSASRPI